jgi:hypothetical protein
MNSSSRPLQQKCVPFVLPESSMFDLWLAGEWWLSFNRIQPGFQKIDSAQTIAVVHEFSNS